jgi:uncharacterized Zn finger protein
MLFTRVSIDFSAQASERTLPMKIIAKCPRCGSTRLLDTDAANHRVRCRRCRMLFKIPRLEEVPKAIKVIKNAKSTVYVDETGKSYG